MRKIATKYLQQDKDTFRTTVWWSRSSPSSPPLSNWAGPVSFKRDSEITKIKTSLD